MKLNAKELRNYKAEGSNNTTIRKNPIYIILDNVLDTYNIGSIFRLADAVAAEEVIVCGQAEIPPNTRIKKASINTTEFVKWEYRDTTLEALKELKKRVGDLRILGIEQGEGSVPLKDLKTEFPVALVVGNETHGISKEVLEMCDQIVEIPMWGVNKSLNVMVSLAIVLYKVMEKLEK